MFKVKLIPQPFDVTFCVFFFQKNLSSSKNLYLINQEPEILEG